MDVSFIVMPFASASRPAIGVSLLKSALKNIGVSSVIHYFNLKFAEKIGPKLYDKVAEHEYAGSSLIGELIFSHIGFKRLLKQKEHLRSILFDIFEKRYDEWSEKNVKESLKEIIHMQEFVSSFIEECRIKVLQENPKLIGFTSTFHQNSASLLLGRIIKNHANIPIIFGGANCEGEMGRALLKIAPWVDFVCSGEGDIAFIEFIKAFLRGEHHDQKINGLLRRKSNFLDAALTSPVMNMDDLPYPDFDDYFTTINSSPIKKELQPSLVIETSRGCWWGEKYQCTFCGLNGSTLNYRSKTVDRVLEEVRYLSTKYGRTRFQVIDNILDLKYIDKLFPKICDIGLKVELFYETKSNLSKKQLLLMKKGGVNEIQPGIESLSDVVLNIMRKGVSGLHNIQLLKWCSEINITPYWNLIWGLPGEPPEEYYRMEEIVPLLVHLYPPSGFGKIVLDRFSPYFMEPLQNGIVNVRPVMGYHYIYSLPDELLCKIAYHFDFDYLDGRVPASYVEGFKANIVQWKELWNAEKIPVLNTYHAENLVMIRDTRPSAVQEFHILSDEIARIYDICDAVHSLQSILVKLKQHYPLLTENYVEELLYDLLDKKLMLCNNNGYLSLAVPIVQNERQIKEI